MYGYQDHDVTYIDIQLQRENQSEMSVFLSN